jgi:hypothetical protein|tara:strand:+ start:1386 stop:1871 length:486 start_codon:yes stop_codon:yes gene_type:complete
MANNVYSTIQFQEGDNEAEREFIRIFEFIQTFDEKGLEFADFYLTNQEIVDDEFMEDWVGPRKAVVTNFMGTEVEIKSSWISPRVFFEGLLEHLRNTDPDVKLSMQYEDEFLMFCGVYVNDKNIEESGGWFKAQFDKLEDDELDFLEFVEDIQIEWLDELC